MISTWSETPGQERMVFFPSLLFILRQNIFDAFCPHIYHRSHYFVFRSSVINIGGLSVTGKDMVDIRERNRFLPGRVRNE